MFKLGVAGNKNTTGRLIKFLIEEDWPLSFLITLDDNHNIVKNISGYETFKNWNLPANVEIYHPEKYSLLSDVDKRVILNHEVDILLVLGWQRLIPTYWIDKLKVGAFGMHGSSELLPKGRGRSPLNWAIIKNEKYFITNFFKYSTGVDSGDIVDSVKFKINPHDTGGSLQLKNTEALLKILSRKKQDLLNGKLSYLPQLKVCPTYFPKRRPMDGEILWDLDATDIDRLIRAVTTPFPGARTLLNGKEMIIWKGQVNKNKPGVQNPYKVGEIIDIFKNRLFVQCGLNQYIITDYEYEDQSSVSIGQIFYSRSNHCWDWTKLPIEESDFCKDYNSIPERYRLYPGGKINT